MTVEARLTCGGVCRTIPLTQYDEGQKIHLNGIILPASYLAEFANSESGTAEQIAQTTDTVLIPDKYLTSGNPIYCWIVVVGEDERTTRYEIIVPVRGRGEPDDYTPTPSEQTAIEAAITALNEAVTAAGVAIEHYPRITDGVWQVWDVTSGEWISTGVKAIGEDGASPSISVSAITGGHRITVTDANGTRSFDVMDGEDGRGIVSIEKTGTAGLVDTYTITYTDNTTSTFTVINGKEGFSPTIAVTEITGGHRVTVTNKSGSSYFDVLDGQPGQPGPGVPAGGTTGQMLVKKSDSDYDGEWVNQPRVPVQDVQINETSILDSQGVANVPVASASDFGVVKIDGNGIEISTQGKLLIRAATDSQIKSANASYNSIVPTKQHQSTFYGLAAAAGDTTQSASSNAVGTYTESAKSAISQMLDAPETVSGTTPSITAKAGVRYVCGECATLTIVAPASGIIDVTFESGSTPTVLTVTPPTGMTMRWIGDDPTALEANKHYEINIMDGCNGMVVSWT